MTSNSRVERPAGGGNPARRRLWRTVIAIGALFVVLLAVDFARRAAQQMRTARSALPQDDPLALVMGVQDQRYVDPGGRFAITFPKGWIVRTGPGITEYAAVLRGPRDLEVCVQVNDIAHDRFDLLFREIRKIEEDYGLDMHITTNVPFQGRMAVERQIRLFEKTVFAIDFLDGHTAHHLQGAAPRDRFAHYEPLLRKIVETYEVRPGAAPSLPEAASRNPIRFEQKAPRHAWLNHICVVPATGFGHDSSMKLMSRRPDGRLVVAQLARLGSEEERRFDREFWRAAGAEARFAAAWEMTREVSQFGDRHAGESRLQRSVVRVLRRGS